MGYVQPEDACQERIRFWGNEWEIIGVVADHHQQSFHVPAEPVIFSPFYTPGSYIFVKLSPENLQETIAAVKNEYLKFFPGNSFSHFFLDDFFNRQYQNDRNFRSAFSLFASLGVLLACLGLFSLASFNTTQRTKEVGIRKVVGASAFSIVGLFIKDFSRIVILATLLASPLTYYILRLWLNGYAYHLNVSWLMLVVPGMITLTIALLTVTYQTVKAARLNPVEPLKYE
jgi:putative ABC transport system permease protein